MYVSNEPAGLDSNNDIGKYVEDFLSSIRKPMANVRHKWSVATMQVFITSIVLQPYETRNRAGVIQKSYCSVMITKFI